MKPDNRINQDEGGKLVRLFSNYIIGIMKCEIHPQARKQANEANLG